MEYGSTEVIDRDVELLTEAAAHELGLQFGDEPTAEDPSILEMTARRLRVNAWFRFYLRQVGEAVDDAEFADSALRWMSDHQHQLAETIFSMDRRAKEAEMARRGAQVLDDPAFVNQVGQAAMLQANVRFLVEAVAASLRPR